MASITIWVRLEPRPRDGALDESLQAQVRDPLWLLARQWQFGEFQGENTGSLVGADLIVESGQVTHYYPGPWRPGAEGQDMTPTKCRWKCWSKPNRARKRLRPTTVTLSEPDKCSFAC